MMNFAVANHVLDEKVVVEFYVSPFSFVYFNTVFFACSPVSVSRFKELFLTEISFSMSRLCKARWRQFFVHLSTVIMTLCVRCIEKNFIKHRM